ncbi:MFS general substrate transporter [Suhomyces tanzawaensis NRRL Y-17324]|uniref:MFS general substrate transporter n=1 Tax=Suhomyces tanzawaensis NRRL Y-17324 TaxID=984487 RepID=A0A1E4SHU8_9ASCO|nr:MFS general substrate transporter [Suhomyces tanzawaensis NRRL Y-17324]ODV79002.1 MFS general substrate transporter [Suhomyces tanzawaensis NRRL Y-17324]
MARSIHTTRSIHTVYTQEEAKEHNAHIIQPPRFTSLAIATYFKTRIPSLFVPKEELLKYSKTEIFFPFAALSELNAKQWNFFCVGLAAWTWDALDFFTTSLNVSSIAKSLDVSVKDVTWGITLVLMLRTVGAIIFGIWSDTKGRKWPYITNLILLIVLQIGTGFVQTYKQFLGVRALFGIAMGGLFGICAADALGDAPPRARGILSGMFQEGYALGYLLAVVFQRAIADNSPHTWRAMFWFSAGVPVIFIVWRYFTPETDSFIRQKERFNESSSQKKSKFKEFKSQARKAFKQYWLICLYSVFMMSGFNFMSHGSQDLYPTLLTVKYGYSHDRATVTNAVANLGAIAGGMVFGHFSTFIGRRLAIILACLLGGAMIYPWAFIEGSGINAGAFFLQFGVQGAWGVIPIHLSELAPPQFRSLVTGVSYQLGNLCSSASSTIESTIGERFPLEGGSSGVKRYDYSKVMAIFIACVFTFVILIVLVGPENRGADLGIERDDVADENGLDIENEDHKDASQAV